MKLPSTPTPPLDLGASLHARRTRTRSRLAAPGLLAATVLAAAACGGASVTPASPTAGPGLAEALEGAIEAEALDSTRAERYFVALDAAVASPRAEGSLAVALAAVDALALSGPPTVDALSDEAIAYRDRTLFPAVVAHLAQAWIALGEGPADAETPASGEGAYAPLFLRGVLARGLHDLALSAGDEQAAITWAGRRGCAQEATVVGPLDAAPLRSLDDASPIAANAPLAATYAGIAPFAAQIAPVVVHADGCELDGRAASALAGLRAVVVDLASPRAQTVGLALTSSSAAVVEAGGVRVIRRGFEAGGHAVTRLAAVSVPAGKTRIVIRVGEKGEDGTLELDAWGEDGLPVPMVAPRAGDVAGGRAASTREIAAVSPSGAQPVLEASALLALGDARGAEHLLEPLVQDPACASRLAVQMLYARAVELAGDLPDAKAKERARAAVERVLAAAPTAWEAMLLHAAFTEQRRGAGEGLFASLRELGAAIDDRGAVSASAPATRDRMVLAYVATTAARGGVRDIAEQAFGSLSLVAPGSGLLADTDEPVHPRVGPEAVRAACSGGTSRAGTACLDALAAQGDTKGVLDEVARLRRLRSAPEAYRDAEISARLAAGDAEGALSVYDAMLPAARVLLSAPGLLAARGGDGEEARARIARDRTIARDAPYSLGPLDRLLGGEPDPTPALEAEGQKLVAADRAQAFLPGAAVAILRHIERYRIEATGLVHYAFYDLRRVSGTTDVEQGAQTYGPQLDGRAAPRLLRRRIHKRDGRVLEPDAAAHASQGHADLSQLEQGDYVEHIADGWALPSDSGQIVLDTPDLMPERTSVREADIEVRRASSIPMSVWSHPLLGRPEEHTDGGYTTSVWKLRDAPPRRIEDGVPSVEQGVGVSLGTQTWAGIARTMDENLRTFDDRDPFVTRWASEAAGADRAPSRALVERVVAATGKAVKVSGGSELSDVAAAFGGGAQVVTARSILELGSGSRSWVIYRVLRELGVKAELAIVETEPFSASPGFPPHAGRFRHPLVRVSLEGGDLWVDADVEGPPLPPGRISPELRGRQAMLAGGQIITVDAAAAETGDEIDVRLALDDKGDAKGTFTALLHGRPAQALAESFETVVGSDRSEMLRAVVLGWLPWADVDDVSLSSSEGSWEVALRASIAIQGYGRPEGKDGKTWVLPGLEPVHEVFPRAAASTLGATYASRGARQSALSIEATLQYHVRRTIELPKGASVTREPAPVHVKGARLTAERGGSFAGTTLEESFTLSLPTGVVAAGDYPAFVEQVRAVDDGFMSGTRVRVAR